MFLGAALCRAEPCRVPLRYAMTCHIVPCYAMFCDAILCYAMKCCVMLCCVPSSFARLCCARGAMPYCVELCVHVFLWFKIYDTCIVPNWSVTLCYVLLWYDITLCYIQMSWSTLFPYALACARLSWNMFRSACLL